ncbi:N-acyl homoserine lactonase family protein [Labrys monachus]|uniref:Glyoxylase-like metal-dependent hydrolase (Beta-lactamase superfamily II) n=1 Tax=Labrys monachus TaxID=217067 RepID=A0ABU0FFM5_9HYPH|nr:N-acyl homoserine lactonase family protein [Labrys monachus]MDQ0393414.1 glyoxylase-like metal-dependent hydrolase (beta-lactamase superfamily II) [Labrys monachus]
MTGDATPRGTIDRLYALNAGLAVAPDRSVYSPGRWKGEQITLSCNAYLMRRAGEWMMWDTGIDDGVAEEAGGRVIAHTIRGIVVRTIVCQLADVGITPADVGRVFLSHAHFDHIGNAGLFRHAVWHIQRREHEAMFGPDYEDHGYAPSLYRCLNEAKVELADGDLDVFGDGSVRVVSTPGHTPGHCSLLVRLAKTGPVLLSGDVAHYRFNMEHRCVPSMNSDPGESRRSMERVDAIVRREGAQLWLNHDVVQTATIPHAPAYFD